MQPVFLRAVCPFLAMHQSTLAPAFFTIPKGAVIKTTYQTEQPGLVQIQVENQPLFAFMRDLREQAEPIIGALAS